MSEPETQTETPRLRMGGIALHNGLVLHTEQFWVVATRRPDDRIQVRSGRKPQWFASGRIGQIPLIRGLARLGQNLAFLPQIRGQAVSGMPHVTPQAMALAAASSAASAVLRRTRALPLSMQEIVVALLALVPALATLKGNPILRYHGVEHKTIAAYEATGHPDMTQVRSSPREHPNCGSSLATILIITSTVGNIAVRRIAGRIHPATGIAVTLLSLASSMELFRWMQRHPKHPLARAMAYLGLEFQSRLTTEEPSEGELEVGLAALDEILRLEDVEAEPA